VPDLAIALFSLIAWLTLIIFMLIPKKLSITENIIMFFCITLIVVSVYTVKGLNLRLVHHSYKPELFISLIIHRNLIITIGLMIFINLFAHSQARRAKIAVSVITLLVLYFTELLTIFTGVKVYTGWNLYLAALNLAAYMTISIFLTKWIRKIP
jgi:hypothetical protein